MPAPAAMTSIVIPAYRASASLRQVLVALEDECFHRADVEVEVVVVESSGDGEARKLAAAFPWVEVVELPDRAPPGRTRNVGVRRTSGEVLAFLDADAPPEPGWLHELRAALSPNVDAVAGSVVNGTPRSAVGTAEYLLEFSEWLPARRTPPKHGAACNLLIRRDALARAGGFNDHLRAGEDTLVTFPLGRHGRLAFAPDARVRHLNRTSLRPFLANQRVLGAGFAAICARIDFPHRRMGRPLFAPLAVPLRLAAVWWRLLVDSREFLRPVVVSPFLLAGVVAWASGIPGARR